LLTHMSLVIKQWRWADPAQGNPSVHIYLSFLMVVFPSGALLLQLNASWWVQKDYAYPLPVLKIL
jgi:hypothetical protein